MRWLMLFLSLCTVPRLWAGPTNVIGLWSTKEAGSTEPQVHIRIYKKAGLVYGEIIRVAYLKNPPPAVVTKNGQECRQPLVGTVILKDLHEGDDSWEDGSLLDPNSGSEYRCRVWRDGGHLKVRGYQFVFYRTFTWFPVEETGMVQEPAGKNLRKGS